MNTLRYTALIVSVILLTFRGAAQTRVDSLLVRLESEKSDTGRIMTLLEISTILRSYDPSRALHYSEQSLNESMKIGFKQGIGDSYRHLGVAKNNLGDYQAAAEYFTKSVDIYEEIDDKQGLAATYNSFGRLWATQKDHEKALQYFRESQKICLEVNKVDGIASTYLNIGTTYDQMGYPDSGLRYTTLAMNIYQELGNDFLICSGYLGIGGYYEERGEDSLALDCYKKSLDISRRINAKTLMAESYSSYGLFHKDHTNYDLAITYYDSALGVANEIQSYELLHNITNELKYLYYATGQYKEAVRLFELNRQYEDSLGLRAMVEELTRFEWSRMLEQERQIQDQEMSRILLIRNFTWIALGLVLILVFFIYRNYRANQKAKGILEEVDQLKSRMFSNISHEFRTPLTLILSPLEEMLSEDSRMSFSKKTISMMHRNASQLLSLVNQMLDLSKMDAGKLKLELK
jgi:tetratricopeptide (TPR) repeat protein